MADNITLNSGSGGATLAADDISSVWYQRVKVTYGADGSATDVSDSNPLPVDDAGGSLTVDNGGTFAVQVDGDALTALQLIDDAVQTDDAAYTLGTDKGVMIMGFAGTQSVNANDAAALACDTDGALHVADGGNSLTVDNGGTFVVQVDGTALTRLTDIETNTDYGAVVGGGAEATALRVTIANDSTGVVSVDDGGGALTVDGTVTANLGATDNAVLDNIDTQTSPPTSHYRNVDANAEAAIKGSAGVLYWVHVMNMTASVAYLHLYDATTAAVTPGTTTPDYTFPIPTQGDTNGAGFMAAFPNGISFTNAITLVCTTTIDGSTGDPGTNGVFVNASYE